jgi:DnaJ-domain-containing protein 1
VRGREGIFRQAQGSGTRLMTRLAAIIILIVAGLLILRYVMRMLVQSMGRGSGPGASANREHVDPEEKYRTILGVTDRDSPATIKAKYKELLAKYHPDKVQHLGREFQEMAEMKTKAITEAYEFFRKKGNF